MARKRWAESGDLNRCCFCSLSPYWQMGILRPVVRALTSIVLSPEPHDAECCRIGPQAIGDDPGWREAVFPQKFHHQFCGDLCVSSALDQEVKHLAFIVDGSPQPVSTAVDRDYHLVEVPVVARPRPRAADVSGDGKPELEDPSVGRSRKTHRRALSR